MHNLSASPARVIRMALIAAPLGLTAVLCGGAVAGAETPNANRPAVEMVVKVQPHIAGPELADYDLSAGSAPAIALAGAGIVTLGAGGAFAILARRRD